MDESVQIRHDPAVTLANALANENSSLRHSLAEQQAEIERLKRISSAAHEHAEHLIKSNSVLARIGGMALKHVLDRAALKESQP